MAAAFVALFLCLGVQRFIVVCNGPECDGVIEWLHCSRACCVEVGDHETDCADGCGHSCHEGDRGQERESVRQAPCCSDTPLSVEEGPPPERLTWHVEVVAHGWVGAWERAPLQAAHPLHEFPPSTGPPRVAQALGLLATTVLLI